jgi:hypothetical protein
MGERDQALSVGRVIRDVIAVYRRHWAFLVPVAIVVLLPQALADAFLDGLRVEGVRSAKEVAILAAVPLTVAVNLFGQALYTGITAAAVVEWRSGNHVASVGALVRSLPIRGLIVLDVLISVGAAIGFALLVVPGLVFLAYVAISPALMKFEHLGVKAALERSVELVRGQFWRVFAILIAAIALTEGGFQAITFSFHGLGLAAVVDLAAEGLLAPIEGLTIVVVALALLERQGEAPSATALAGALGGGGR